MIVAVVVADTDPEIFVSAQVDIVVRRIAVVIDIEILFGEIDILDFLGLLLLHFLEGDRLLRLEHRLGVPGISAIDASDRIVLAQIVKPGAAFRAAMLGPPFGFDHSQVLVLAPSGEPENFRADGGAWGRSQATGPRRRRALP